MLLLPGRLAAQGHLAGRVLDGQTGAPLAAVRVTVGEQTVTTGSAGKYHLIVPPGRTEISFSATGYATRRDTLDIADGAVIQRDVNLTRAAARYGSGAIARVINIVLEGNSAFGIFACNDISPFGCNGRLPHGASAMGSELRRPGPGGAS